MSRMFDQYLVKENQLLAAIYDQWPVGEEQLNINQDAIAPGMSPSAVGKAMRQFESLGIVTKRMTYGDPTADAPNIGRRYHYTLLVTREDAEGVLAISQYGRKNESDRHHAEANDRGAASRRGHKQPRKEHAATPVMDTSEGTALATNSTEEVRAIAGDEPDNSLAGRIRDARRVSGALPDESGALVEAARQYQGRSGELKIKVAELEAVARDLGMTIDTGQLMASVSIEPDPVLEVVAQTLPYINGLEQRIARQAETIAEQRERLKGYDELRNENRRLHEQNQRLISGRVVSAQAPARA